MRRLLISVLKGLNFIVRKISAFTHFVQFALQWGFHPRPEWFDHYLDQHWQFSAKNNGLWVERGVFSRMVLKPDATGHPPKYFQPELFAPRLRDLFGAALSLTVVLKRTSL